MTTEKKLELLRGKVAEKLERVQGSSSSPVISREAPSNSKRPRLDHSTPTTTTQPEAPSQEAQGNLENDVHLQDSESLVVHMEISEEPREQTSPAQSRGDLHQPTESTPEQSPPVKVSSKNKNTVAFHKNMLFKL